MMTTPVKISSSCTCGGGGVLKIKLVVLLCLKNLSLFECHIAKW